MKRFLVFCGEEHYPAGGWRDFVGDADTMIEALDMIIKDKIDHRTEWSDIVDTTTGDIILPINYTTWRDRIVEHD